MIQTISRKIHKNDKKHVLRGDTKPPHYTKRKTSIMKKTIVSIFLLLLLTSTLYLPNAFAQDYTQLSLPEGAKARLGKGSITEIAYSPDGTRLAVASSIGIWIYDAETGEELDLLTGHTGGVESIAFSPDGNILASASWDDTIRLWDVATGESLRTLTGHRGAVKSIAFSPDGKTLAGGSFQEVRLWDVNTGSHLHTLTGHTVFVESIAFSPDGNILASASWDGEILLWDTNIGENLRTLTGHTVFVESIAFSPDGNILASASWDDTIRLWDAATGEHLRTLRHTESVTSVAFSPDGNILTSASRDGEIFLWDVNIGRYLHTLTGHTESVESVAFSPDGNILASGSRREVRLWDVNIGEHLRTLTGHTELVESVAFSSNGQTLASGSRREVRLWDANIGEHLRTLRHTDYVASVAFSPDGNILASASDGEILLWDANTGRYLQTLTGHTDYVESIAFSPNRKTLASGSWDETVLLWDANTGSRLHTLIGHTDYVASVAFSPDGNILASGSWVGEILLWDANIGEHLRTLIGHTESVESIAFSPNGQTLASGSRREVRLWDANIGEHLHTLRHTDYVESIVFSPDGNILASASDGEILLWDAKTGRYLHTLTGHTDYVESIAFSPDGNILASGSDDGTVLLWEIETLLITIELFPAKIASSMIGKQLTFSLNITDGENVAGYQTTVEYDTSALRYVDSANGDYLPLGAFFVPPVVSENKVTLGASSLAGVSNGEGTLATITFEVVDVKKSTIAIDETILTNSEGEHLPHLAYGTKIVEPSLLPSSAVVSITPSSVLSPAIGEQLTFNVEITGGQNVKDFQLTFDYDKSALTYITRSRGSYLDGGVGNGDGTLETVTFEVLAVKASTINFSGYLVSTNGLRYVPTFEGILVIVPLFGDVNRDGKVNTLDLVLVASSFGQSVIGNPADVNEDGVVNIVDLVKVAGALSDDAAAPSTWSLNMDDTFTRAKVQKWLSEAQQLNLTDPMSRQGIRFLQQLLTALTPKETALLPNYPNPFNPETWIPYQLAAPANVSIKIYAVDGKLVRSLALGHQPIGIYQSKKRAAHWDGRNAQGESVVNGVYFYTLTAGDFSATRKMLIMK